MTLRRAFILTFALAALGAPAAQADYTKVVTGNRFTVLRLTNASSCETGTGYRWANVPGERSASLKFTGGETTLGGSPPYNNADPNYPVPPGLNQLFSNYYFASAGDPNACEPQRQNSERSFSATAQVTLQIAGDSPACAASRATLVKRQKAVNALKGKLRKAKSKKSKKKLKSKLGKATKQQKSAAKVVGTSC